MPPVPSQTSTSSDGAPERAATRTPRTVPSTVARWRQPREPIGVWSAGGAVATATAGRAPEEGRATLPGTAAGAGTAASVPAGAGEIAGGAGGTGSPGDPFAASTREERIP